MEHGEIYTERKSRKPAQKSTQALKGQFLDAMPAGL